MPKDKATAADQPLRDTEQAAYHAFREWPILLVLKQKELAAHGITPTAQFSERAKADKS